MSGITFGKVWQQLVTKRPELEKPETKVEFTAGNLRRLLEQVYEQGQKSAADGSDGDRWFFRVKNG